MFKSFVWHEIEFVVHVWYRNIYVREHLAAFGDVFCLKWMTDIKFTINIHISSFCLFLKIYLHGFQEMYVWSDFTSFVHFLIWITITV